jgi:hypothetical protein
MSSRKQDYHLKLVLDFLSRPKILDGKILTSLPLQKGEVGNGEQNRKKGIFYDKKAQT